MAILTRVAVAQPTSSPPSDTTADRARALELFRASDADYKRGDFESAAALLREAYALHPEPLLLYNLARALEGLGDFPGAIDAYERYLSADTKIEDRGAIERRVATLRDQVARTAAPVDEPPPPPPPAEPVITSPPAGEPAHVDRATHRSRLPWIVAGGGAAVVGVGVGFAYLSSARHQDAEDAPIQVDAVRLQDRARTYATAANVTLAIGGVALAAGIGWALYARAHDHAPSGLAAHVVIGPGQVAAAWELP